MEGFLTYLTCLGSAKFHGFQSFKTITHRIYGAAIYGNIYHQYTPNVSIYIYIYHTWILWVMTIDYIMTILTIMVCSDWMISGYKPLQEVKNGNFICKVVSQTIAKLVNSNYSNNCMIVYIIIIIYYYYYSLLFFLLFVYVVFFSNVCLW